MTKSIKHLLSGLSFMGVALVVVLTINAELAMAQPCCGENTGITVAVTPSSALSAAQSYTASYPASGTASNTYKIENETVYRDEEQTRVRQVWEDEIRERRYTVLRQIPETTIKKEIYKVLKPVWTTEYRDTSYDVIRTVPETSVREERYTVSRPVWETAEREVVQTVRRPVQETYMQERRYTVNRPVTSYKPELVDRGQYVNYTAVDPGKTYHRLAWQRGGDYVDPATGATRRQLPGLYWTPMHGDPKYRQETVYQPNYVEQLTPVTTLVPETIVEQVPTTRLTYQEEKILKKEPYQVMRMVQEERVRQIPETKYRQVVERVQQTTPVQVQRIETQEVSRDIPVTNYKTVTEERVEQYTVKVPRVEKIVETVQKPYVVQKRIPLDEFGNPTTIYPGPATPSYTISPDMGTSVGTTGGTGSNAGGSRETYGGQSLNENGSQNGSTDPASTMPAIPPKEDGLGLGSGT